MIVIVAPNQQRARALMYRAGELRGYMILTPATSIHGAGLDLAQHLVLICDASDIPERQRDPWIDLVAGVLQRGAVPFYEQEQNARRSR